MGNLRNLSLGVALASAFALFGPVGLAVGHSGHGYTHPDAGSLTGLVTDEHGLPVAGACVKARGVTRWGAQHVVRSDATGRYEIAGLTPGRYVGLVDPTCRAPGRIGEHAAIWSGGALVRRDADVLEVFARSTTTWDVAVPSAATLEVSVADADAPVTTCVRAYSAGARFDIGRPDLLQPRRDAVVQMRRVREGAATIGGLVPGRYDVLVGCFARDDFEAPATYGYMPRWVGPVTLAAGTTTPVTTTLARAGVISGRIRDQDARARDAEVLVYGSPDRVLSRVWASRGAFMSGRLAPGSYRVRAMGYGYGYGYGSFDEWFDAHAATFAEATPLPVLAGEVTSRTMSIEIAIPPAANLAVSDLRVEDRVIRTDVPTPAVRATGKRISFTIGETMQGEISYAPYAVWIRARQTNGRYAYLTVDSDDLGRFTSGQRRSFVYDVNPPALGDLDVFVEVCGGNDHDASDDRAHAATHVVVEGTGTIGADTQPSGSALTGWSIYEPGCDRWWW